MTLRQAMLDAARRAPEALGPSARLVADFLRNLLNPDGGFRGRSDPSDLYYTVFGLEASLALGLDLPRDNIRAWLDGFGDGEGLDFVHLCCLARCWADLSADAPPAAIPGRLDAFRAADGGYAQQAGADHGTAYGAFLAVGALGDCGSPIPEPDRLLANLDALRTDDGGYANEAALPAAATPATAATLVLLHHLGRSVHEAAIEWLRARCMASGGFLAAASAPMPDLLSTATALHALATAGVPLDGLREPCLDYLDTLWDRRGGFHGSWADDVLDCEYLFYGLLALGHLAPIAR